MKKTHPLSLAALTLLPCSPIEQIEVALKAGFDGVSLRLLPVMDTDVDVMADSVLQRDIEQALADSGLKVFDVEVVRATPETVVKDLLPVFEFAGSIGAQRLAVTSGTVEEYGSENQITVLRRLEELCVAGSRYDVGVMLEFIPYRGIASFGQALDVVHAVGHPGLAVTVDALHFFRSGGAVDQLAQTDPALLACAQLCDAPAAPPADLPLEARYGRLFPGEGGLPLDDFVGALPHGLPVCVEIPAANHGGMSILERARRAASSAQDALSGAKSAN
jgi:sugar phosphate isomerase/epimerase